MKKYQTTSYGTILVNGTNVPIDINSIDYLKLLSEVESGEAVIEPYVEPSKTARQVRDEALVALVYDFGDGRVIQVRPKDEPNFERAYHVFTLTNAPTIGWVMADDVKHPVTEADLRKAHDAGILAGAAIWDAYDPGT